MRVLLIIGLVDSSAYNQSLIWCWHTHNNGSQNKIQKEMDPTELYQKLYMKVNIEK